MKSELRKAVIARRASISPKTRNERCKRILENIISLDEVSKGNVFFVYISKDTEVDTRILVQMLFDSGKTVAAPFCDSETMSFRIISSFDNLEKGCFGVFEPTDDCASIAPREKDVCLVPALAYNERGHRIGYGKGYYDRFLSKYKCIKIGLCYEENIIDFVQDEHDVPVDIIVTEAKAPRRINGK